MSYNSPFTGNVVQPTDVSYREINLTSDLQLEWPINGTTTGNAAARIMDVLPDQAGWDLFMPPANQTSVGNDAMIRNIGAFTCKCNSNCLSNSTGSSCDECVLTF